MRFLPKLFYNDDASNNGGAAQSSTTSSTENNAAAANANDTPKAEVVIPEDIQKELAELREFKKNAAAKIEKTPEELAKEAELEQADFRKTAIANDWLKNDDFKKYETVQQKQDRELVYENWLTSWKEENPDIAPEDVESLSKADFENEYGLSTDNEKKLKRAQDKLAKEAKELRSPYENKYIEAQGKYKSEQELRKTYPVYQKYISDKVNENVKDKIKFFEKEIDGEKIGIEIEFSEDERKEIAEAAIKELSNPQTYISYTQNTKDGKNEILDKIISKEVNYLINEKKREAVLEQTAETFTKIGLKKGSNVGATQPYALTKNNDQPAAVIKMSPHEAVNKSQQEVRSKMGR